MSPVFTTDHPDLILSHDVASGSDLTPCNRIDKTTSGLQIPLLYIRTFVISLHKSCQNINTKYVIFLLI